MLDVVVIGTGTRGLVTALLFAETGASVTLVDPDPGGTAPGTGIAVRAGATVTGTGPDGTVHMTWAGRATSVQADLVIRSGSDPRRSVNGRLVGTPTLLDAAALITELARRPRLSDGLTAYLAG